MANHPPWWLPATQPECPVARPAGSGRVRVLRKDSGWLGGLGGGAKVTSMESPSEEGNLRNSEEEGEYLGKGYHEYTHLSPDSPQRPNASNICNSRSTVPSREGAHSIGARRSLGPYPLCRYRTTSSRPIAADRPPLPSCAPERWRSWLCHSRRRRFESSD